MELSVLQWFFRKESSCMMDGWPWNCEGGLGALRDVWQHSVWVLTSKGQWKACWVKMNSCCLFLKVLLYLLSHMVVIWCCLMMKQYTFEATIVQSIALDDAGASASQQMTNFRCFRVVEYVNHYVACVARAGFQFFLAFRPSQSPFDWESMHQHLLSSSGEKFSYPPCSIWIGSIRNYM